MKYFSMFAGVGGFDLGIQRAIPNAECIGFSEVDKYCNELLKKKFKGVINYGDARKINTRELPDFDMLCGGYPCQSFSIAGKRKGFEDIRGTLFFQIERIAKAKRPKIILLENVKGLLSHDKGNTWKVITQHLNNMGYLVDYRILNSKYFGVPQNRERIFHIGYDLKWLIKENVKDGQVKRNSQLEKMLKGWLLENLLKDLEELKNLSEIKLKEWILNYLRYICGNQTRLEYSKTIKNSQIKKSQKSLKEHLLQSHTKEKRLDSITKDKEKSLEMVQDIYESMMEKGIDYGFIELWQKSILENLKKNNQSTISIIIKKIIEKKTFSCASLNLIIGWFILQQKDYWEKWLNQEVLNLIKIKEFIQHERRRNKTKLRERNMLRNIRTSVGFTEPFDKRYKFIIGNIRGTSRPEILPFRENAKEIPRLYEGKKKIIYDNHRKDEIREYEECSFTLSKAMGDGGNNIPIVMNLQQRSKDRPSLKDNKNAGGSGTLIRDDGNTYCLDSGNNMGVMNCIGTCFGRGGSSNEECSMFERTNYALAMRKKERNKKKEDRIEQGQQFEPRKDDNTNTLSSVEKDNYCYTNQLRRLIPVECERLQGFPDDWTEGFSNTQRYKMMGNAVTVNVIEALMKEFRGGSKLKP